MHENASRRKHIVRSIQRMDSITKELAEELRDGLEFGLVWGKEPSVATWEDVYLDKDHIVARVPYGFQVHRVTPQFQPRAT
ncbi:hypothetical protein FRC17_006525 [Serendipita sp. 399]|nr:hypothetical protein FRC17_006525 [Serendipita sp. 399]